MTFAQYRFSIALTAMLLLMNFISPQVLAVGVTKVYDQEGNLIREAGHIDIRRLRQRMPALKSAPSIKGLLIDFHNPADENKQMAVLNRITLLLNDNNVLLKDYQDVLNSMTIDLGRYYFKDELEFLVDDLKQDPDIEIVTFNSLLYLRSVSAPVIPNDQSFTKQTYLNKGVGGINATYAWAITKGNPNITVAVLDTGSTPHLDLTRTKDGYDFISDDSCSLDNEPGRDRDTTDVGDWVFINATHVEPSTWHSLHVSGILGANTNNTFFVSGVDWKSHLMPIRVINTCAIAKDIRESILWAAGFHINDVPDNKHRAKIINLSLGDEERNDCQPYQEAINKVVGRGVTVVVAASSDHGITDYYPLANCQNVIVVTAIDERDNLPSYADCGYTVDIAAPGGTRRKGILSTFNSGITDPDEPVTGSIVAELPGTSMATPMVSGTVSLMLSVNPDLTPAEIKTILKETSRAFPSTSNCMTDPHLIDKCGKGILDTGAAVWRAKELWKIAHPHDEL